MAHMGRFSLLLANPFYIDLRFMKNSNVLLLAHTFIHFVNLHGLLVLTIECICIQYSTQCSTKEFEKNRKMF